MENLERQVRRVRRRLTIQRFLTILGWCWFAALMVALAMLGAARIWSAAVGDGPWMTVALMAGALAGGLTAALVWCVVVAPSPLEAAMEIDRRFQLDERVSSTLAMTPAQCESEAGESLRVDAAGRIARLDVAGRFPVRLPRQLLLPLAPGLLVMLLSLGIRPAVVETAPAMPAASRSAPPEIKRAAELLENKLAQHRHEAEKKGLKDAAELFLKLEDATRQLEAETQRDTALVTLNDLARQLDARRRTLADAATVRQQLDSLQTVGDGQAAERRMLDSATQQLSDARRRMNCPHCGGTGCKQCQPEDADEPVEDRRPAHDPDRPGHEPDLRADADSRPEREIDGRFYDSRVKQRVGKGAATVTGPTDGPNVRGRVETEIQEQLQSVRHGTVDPPSGQRLPHSYGEHVREYFDLLREGE